MPADAPSPLETSSLETSPLEAPAKRRSGALLAGGAVVAALALAGAAYPIWRSKAPEPPPRFLLIEKQADPEAPVASPEPVPATERGEPTPASARSAPPVTVEKVARAGDASASGSTITAAFQRQRGRVEACFRTHSTEDQPQLTIRFQVEASGVVRSADLQPASLGGTALGGCILGIARATKFPAGEAPVAFSIPITARKAAR